MREWPETTEMVASAAQLDASRRTRLRQAQHDSRGESYPITSVLCRRRDDASRPRRSVALQTTRRAGTARPTVRTTFGRASFLPTGVGPGEKGNIAKRTQIYSSRRGKLMETKPKTNPF